MGNARKKKKIYPLASLSHLCFIISKVKEYEHINTLDHNIKFTRDVVQDWLFCTQRGWKVGNRGLQETNPHGPVESIRSQTGGNQNTTTQSKYDHHQQRGSSKRVKTPHRGP